MLPNILRNSLHNTLNSHGQTAKRKHAINPLIQSLSYESSSSTSLILLINKSLLEIASRSHHLGITLGGSARSHNRGRGSDSGEMENPEPCSQTNAAFKTSAEIRIQSCHHLTLMSGRITEKQNMCRALIPRKYDLCREYLASSKEDSATALDTLQRLVQDLHNACESSLRPARRDGTRFVPTLELFT
jgi:hypothetical protein